MKIEFYKKDVYGTTLMYIKDEENAEMVQRLTGKKTISDSDIRTLTALGCELIQVLP